MSVYCASACLFARIQKEEAFLLLTGFFLSVSKMEKKFLNLTEDKLLFISRELGSPNCSLKSFYEKWCFKLICKKKRQIS